MSGTGESVAGWGMTGVPMEMTSKLEHWRLDLADPKLKQRCIMDTVLRKYDSQL